MQRSTVLHRMIPIKLSDAIRKNEALEVSEAVQLLILILDGDIDFLLFLFSFPSLPPFHPPIKAESTYNFSPECLPPILSTITAQPLCSSSVEFLNLLSYKGKMGLFQGVAFSRCGNHATSHPSLCLTTTGSSETNLASSIVDRKAEEEGKAVSCFMHSPFASFLFSAEWHSFKIRSPFYPVFDIAS